MTVATKRKNETEPADILLTPGEAARQLGVTTKTLASWVRAGKLRAAVVTAGRQRRFSKNDIDRFMST